MSETTARNKHFHENSNYDPSRIDITRDEFERISDALKKEEFRKLFLDYVEEIQDPENRKKYEEEIIQLEAERGVEVRFVNPLPGFVAKTSENGVTLVYINLCKSDEVERPSSKFRLDHETGNRGLDWSIPLMQSKPREDLDEDVKNKRCRVYDVIFHPDALHLADRNKEFRKMIIDTALDAIEREFKVNLDRTNIEYPKNINYKGLARPTVIRKLAKNPPSETTEPHPLEHIYPDRPTADSGKPKLLSMQKRDKSNNSNNALKKSEFTTPKYRIVHRHPVDLAEYTEEADAKLNMTVPRELVVKIELPLLNTTADCQLDVTEKSLFLLSERQGAKYRLKFDLPYAVNDKDGNASFDTDRRCLSVTLPVKQPSTTDQRKMHETALHLNREDSGFESDVREELRSVNSESPMDELLDETLVEHYTDETSAAQATTTNKKVPKVITETFLKHNLSYQFPSKVDCNVLDDIMSFVLHVRNVQADSIKLQQFKKTLHLKFNTISSGYYPTYYAFYLKLPSDCDANIVHADAEAWENNLVLNVQLDKSVEDLFTYSAGLDSSDLRIYNIKGKLQLSNKTTATTESQSKAVDISGATHKQYKKSPSSTPLASSLDISVERSECERSVEIEIKPRDHLSSECSNSNTTEDEDIYSKDSKHNNTGAMNQQAVLGHKKLSKKQKRKNKKLRSLSESACDDINKAFAEQLQTVEARKQQIVVGNMKTNISEPKKLTAATAPIYAASIGGARKQRSLSECRPDSGPNKNDLCAPRSMPPCLKSILKRCSRYDSTSNAPRSSVSGSYSSIDDCSSLCCSVDGSQAASSSILAHSFSDIPEENVADDINIGLSESCKKTVRFNEVIMKQVFRLDSCILKQRKKNQKRRALKQRALERRLSEGDCTDYEALQQHHEEIQDQTSNNNNNNHRPYFNKKQEEQNESMNNCEQSHTDEGRHLKNSNQLNIEISNRNKNFVKHGKNQKSNRNGTPRRPRLESESSSDIEGSKNAMMFEMEM